MTKKYIEEIIENLRNLDSRLYIGHNLDVEVFDIKRTLLAEFTKSSEIRVGRILHIFSSFPEGKWRKMSYPLIYAYIRRIKEKNVAHSGLTCKWFDKETSNFGYEYHYGWDDGYPEMDFITIPMKWLYIDESKLFSEMLKDVECSIKLAIAEMEDNLILERKVLESILIKKEKSNNE